MSTALQVIERSLRKIGALAAGEAASSDMSTDGLADLNAMLTKWLDLGIEISQGEITLTDTIPTDIADEDAVVYNLGVVLLLEYPNPNAVLIIERAKADYATLLAKYTPIEPLQNELGILTRDSYGYNINTDR